MMYLIFGVNGMAGHMIAQFLIENDDEVIGFARYESPICDTIIGDALNRGDVERAINSASFDYVINAIGVLNSAVDKNPANGIYLNSYFPHLLTELTTELPTKVIHISTDCVFEGTKGRYTENEIADATSMYGRSKFLGELHDEKNLTIRTSIIGPELKTNGIGLFHWFMSQKTNVSGYKKVIWGGVTTLELAKAIQNTDINNKTGLIHLTNNEGICKFDLLNLFNKYCREDKLDISEEQITENDKSIISTRLDIGYKVPTYERMIIEMAEWIENHKELYSQYLH